ncbi:aliphatic sulfonate ABC transporter substrate-binding protein [Aciduricibacillus chroicocephali]|uniref:Aliphatic sulfonate ABC transporter substrate-binding protein n=1 Tax=Aciduricibacillus chroicocephali TaxID=3054939 RepID=A0ABY9KSN7_9BACI|nr:aliphatic sulfonate ABC transporter substrate-binding protein [Bacillaceae bacterium 44XB]
MKKLSFLLVIVLIGILTGCSAKATEKPKEINIGIQQSLSPLWIAKEKRLFEDAFKEDGIKIKWTEFQSGPPQFEGLAANKLDFSQVGNTPVVAGQAANVKFKEIALSGDGVKGNGILVNKNSEIKKLEDLKGKKVAVAKGSSGFGFLYSALKHAKISPDDVEIIQLQPDEALPAFESGKVDAWSIWEPFLSLESIENDAVILANGETLGSFSPSFTLARDGFIKDHPQYVEKFLRVYDEAVRYQLENEEEAIDIYAKMKGLDKKVIKNVLDNTKPLNEPITDRIIKAQQETADLQLELKAIGKKIDVSEVVDNQFIKKIQKEEK